MIAIINVCAASVLIVWATWCGLSRSVNDGIFGKLIYAAIAMASLSIITGQSTPHSYSILNACFALLGIRHYVLRRFKGEFKRWFA